MRLKILSFLIVWLFYGTVINAQVRKGETETQACDGDMWFYLYDAQRNLYDSVRKCFGNVPPIFPNDCMDIYAFSVYPEDSVHVVLAPKRAHEQTFIYTPPNGTPDTFTSLDYRYSYSLPLDSGLRVGTYKIITYRPVYGLGWGEYTNVIITVIPRAGNVWIEAPEICADDFLQAGQDYRFYVKTDLNLADTMFPTPLTNGRPNCALIESYEYNFDVQAGSMQVGNVFTVNGINRLRASQLPIPANYQEYTIPYSELAAHITTYPGLPVQLSLDYSDPIVGEKLSAPLVIKSTDRTGYGQLSASFHVFDYEVKDSEVWTPQNNPVTAMYGDDHNVMRIEGALRIPKGALLSISDMVLEFGEQGKIVVEAQAGTNDHGSTLLLNNTKLTAFQDCGNDDNMWQGVVVQGNASKSQEVIPPNYNGVNRYQGLLVMNNSEISYAQEAVRLWSGDPADWQQAGAGGIVMAKDSRFYNNRRSAEFLKYSYTEPNFPNFTYNNRSRFKDCSFEVDGNYPPGKDFWGFISGWAVRGLTISGCSFENSGYTGGVTRGIYGLDFGVSINKSSALSTIPSRFNNLTYAVEVKSIGGPASLSVANSVFKDNGAAITAEGVMAPRITDNIIINADDATSPIMTRGISIFTGSGYNISGNEISNGRIGVLVTNSGSDPNTVERNSFSDMGTGGLSNYKNTNADPLNNPRGLQFLCNQHDALNYDIAAMGDNPGSDGMAPEQGSLAEPAGNRFYPSSVANLYNQVGAINYYHNPNEVGTTPSNYIGNVQPITTTKASECEDGGTAPNPDVFTGNAPQVYAGYLRAVLDSTGLRRDSLHYWADRWETPYGGLLKTDLLLEEGRTEEAGEVYARITDRYEMDAVEKAEFADYGSRLMELRTALIRDRRNMKQLERHEVEVLEQVADAARLWARVRAQNWLTLYDGREFEQEILYPEGGERGRAALPQAAAQAKADAVYPNPVRNTLQVYYTTESDAALRLELLDLVGRTVLSVPLRKGLNQLDMKALHRGVYYYQVVEGGEVKLKGKLVKE